MADRGRILVVDGLSETSDVLKAILEPRGLQVDRVRGDADASPAGDESRPDVVVLHRDGSADGPQSGQAWSQTPQVVIGTATVACTSADSSGRHFLQQPFHYPELIRAIEQLLERPAA